MNTPAAGRMLRVVVADDHPVVREGIVSIVNRQSDLTVVAEVADGKAAVQAVLEHEPDVTLMDLRMPAMSGLDAIKAIRTAAPAARILVLTTYDGDEDIFRSLQAGARGYLLKDVSSSELVRAIRAAAAGHRVIPSEVGAKLAQRVATCELTERETDVLRLIVAGRSNRQISLELGVTEGTVKGYLKTIFSKMDVTDRTQAATAALRRGIVHDDEVPSVDGN